MTTRELQKIVQANAKRSGTDLPNYSKIQITNYEVWRGNPFMTEYNCFFTYDGHRYSQTARVTGGFSAERKVITHLIV